jgi:hypothetical protein
MRPGAAGFKAAFRKTSNDDLFSSTRTESCAVVSFILVLYCILYIVYCILYIVYCILYRYSFYGVQIGLQEARPSRFRSCLPMNCHKRKAPIGLKRTYKK